MVLVTNRSPIGNGFGNDQQLKLPIHVCILFKTVLVIIGLLLIISCITINDVRKNTLKESQTVPLLLPCHTYLAIICSVVQLH